jgi:hypothetical protein
MIYRFYLRLFATINYFFENIKKDNDPGVPTLLSLTVLFTVYSYGLFYVAELILNSRIKVSSVFFYSVFAFWLFFNYFLAFRKEQFSIYRNSRLKLWQTLVFMILGYVLMGIGGFLCKSLPLKTL